MLSNKILLYSLLFFVAIIFHLIGLNKIGRTWDEQFKVDMGYVAWDRLTAGDFSEASWKQGQEHPMVAKYLYGLTNGPHMVRVDDGAGRISPNITYMDVTTQLGTENFIMSGLHDKLFAVAYDLTFPRFVSAIMNSVAVVLTAALAIFLFGLTWWAVLPAAFLLLTPRFLVMGQLITYESLSVLLFCATLLLFYKLLQHPVKTKLYLYVGLLCGLLFWTRYSNAFVFAFLTGWVILHYLYHKKKDILKWKLLLIPGIAFIFGILIWPLIWIDFPKNLFDTFQQHESRGIGPSLYFAKYLLVTTPIPILIGLVVGSFFTLKERKYWQTFFIWWFYGGLLFYTFLSVEAGGTRYVFLLYPALVMLAAYGYQRILRGKFLYALTAILLFMLIDIFSVYPYYLDYYNQLVGGPAGAAKKSYDFSWWGEGQREVGMWMNENVPSGSSVELIVTPKYVFPTLRRDILNSGYVDTASESAYVVVSRANRGGLSEEFFKNHRVVYESKIHEEPLVSVFQKL